LKNKSRHLMDVVEAGDGMKLNRIIRNLKINEQGAALAYVVVVMTVVFLLMGTMITLSMGENDQAMYQTDYMKAYYIARAGAESMAMEMERMDNSHFGQFESVQLANSTDVLDGDGDLVVSVKKEAEEYRVSSFGTYKSTSAKVDIIMSYKDRTEMDYGVYAKEAMSDLNIDGKNFEGILASGGDIKFGTSSKNNDDVILSPFTTNHVSITVPKLSGFAIENEIDFDTYFEDKGKGKDKDKEEMIIDSSATISNWNVGTANTLTIITDSGNYQKGSVKDYEKTFNLKTSGSEEEWLVLLVQGKAVMDGNIHVTGNNNLMIIVEDEFKLGGGLSFSADYDKQVEFYIMDKSNDYEDDLVIDGNNIGDVTKISGKDVFGEPSRLKFYVDGTNSVSMYTNTTLCGYIVGPEATVDLKTGQMHVYGGIYAKDVQMAAQVLFTDPSASEDAFTLYKQMSIDYWE